MSWQVEKMRLLEEARTKTKEIQCDHIYADGYCRNPAVNCAGHCLLVWTKSRVCGKLENTGKKHENN